MTKTSKITITNQQIPNPTYPERRVLGADKNYKAEPLDKTQLVTNLDGVRQKVFLDRYALKNEAGELIEHTPEEMWHRVAWGISQSEDKKDQKIWEDKFFNIIKDFKFVPAGRILSGAGTSYDVTYFNCFVIPSPKDSRNGILDSLKQLVEIQSRAGGVGLNLSSLRPRGARVKKVNGVSSGPITWAGLFSYATHDVVQQGGSRRGATMIMLWDWHPDIEEFITVKQDLSKINGANLSVCVSDSFMEAVKKDADWDLVYPELDDPEYDEKWDGELDKWISLGKKVKTYKTVKAKYLWNLICQAAWRSAEPGLHFLERSNKRSSTHYFERLAATNPCVTGDTLVSTDKGWIRVDQIKKGDRIGTVMGNGLVDRIEVYDNRPVYKIKFSDGSELRATAAHQFHAIPHNERSKNSANKRFSILQLDELKVGDMVRVHPALMPTNPVPGLPGGWTDRDYGFFMGILIGDGGITEKILKHNILKVAMNRNDVGWGNIVQDLLEKTSSTVTINSNNTDRSVNLVANSMNGASLLVKNSLLTPAYSFEKRIPVEYQCTNKDFLIGLLDGLYSTDGNINLTTSHPQIRLKTTSKQLALDVRRILLYFGVHGHINKIKKVSEGHIGNRAIISKHQQYEVIFSGASIKNFVTYITLSHPQKRKKLEDAQKMFALTGNTWLTQIVSIELKGREKVYDLHEPFSDTWITEGIVSRGCGEQPLGPWAVCNLGAMNLAAYVKDEQFDYESFGKDVKIAMRFLDNVIDQTYYFFPENEKCAKDIRRTGLGIMGLADALILMKVRYGGEESLPIIRNIFETLRDNAYESSIEIAKEKGSFPKFDKVKYLNGYHIKNLSDDLRKRIAKDGIRNAVLLTIAPTGTTSTVAGASSGIEPVYEFSYNMRWRDEGNRGWREDVVYHPLYKQWLKDHPDEKKPDYFVSANDLTPFEHVKVQALAQEFIDSSISKTVNAPNSHTVDDVQNLYMSAYDMGLKGITYMRDGSREGVLTRIEEKKDDKKEAILPKTFDPFQRPMVLHGRTYEVLTPVGKAFITINRDEKGNPMEVFATVGKGGMHVMADAEAIGRLASIALRSSPDPRKVAEKIVTQLRGIGGASQIGFGKDRVMSLADAIAKVLAEDLAHLGNTYPETIPLELNAGSPNNTTNGKGANGIAHDPNLNSTLQQLSLEPQNQPIQKSGDLCPDCGNATLIYEEGCSKCYTCGYSKC